MTLYQTWLTFLWTTFVLVYLHNIISINKYPTLDLAIAKGEIDSALNILRSITPGTKPIKWLVFYFSDITIAGRAITTERKKSRKKQRTDTKICNNKKLRAITLFGAIEKSPILRSLCPKYFQYKYVNVKNLKFNLDYKG